MDTVVDGKTLSEIIHTLPFTFQFNRNLKNVDWEYMDQVLQLHQLLKDIFQWSMDNKRFNLASHWEELGASFQKICLKEIDSKDVMGELSHYPSYRRTADPGRAYLDSFRIARSRPNQLSSGFTAFRNQQISGKESPFFTIPGSFQEKTRIQGLKQDLFQPKADRVRPNDPEAVGIGERRTQEPKIVVHTSRISSPSNRNITPTQTENDVLTPQSNLNSDILWLQMSQFEVQTQESLHDFKRINERFQRNAILKKDTIKAIQESHAQLSKASEETSKRMNPVFKDQHH
ncbi:hypothetical protein O181_063104 [Austropuccinia psidii MF-1]|uniref:Uncharacterized protein n=1 Tax=Austropuccinia psidii MF-1 TaxID=1389203 RepID=A0A9Q3I279_9BASI|nr:hypothetical protein [Austropuccinia psidii MF-1]